jgi:hypothetical protein
MSTCSATLSLSDILLEVSSDGDTQAQLQVANHAHSDGSFPKSAGIANFSWIKLRDQKWFCGWIWGADSERSVLSHGSLPSTGITSSKPVTVNELACNSTMKCGFHIYLI